ncbi:MAG: hypothetical protein ACKO66_07345 [Flavobacteriales bacterium]
MNTAETSPSRNQAISLIQQTWRENPAVHFSIGRGWGFSFRSHELARFFVRFAERRNAMHFDSSGTGVIIFYPAHEHRRTWRDVADEFRLLLLAIGPFRAARVLRRKREIARHHAQFKTFLHCWYFGIAEQHRSLQRAAALRDKLFDSADRWQLPVLAETTIMRNRDVYARMGFEVYAQCTVGQVTTYLLCRYPSQGTV